MTCWNCNEKMAEPAWGKLSFRASCEHCHASLHCCRNCIYHKPGASNECAVPGTSTIADRSAANFCEEFKLKGTGSAATADPDLVAKRLFGQEEKGNTLKDPKKRFDSLFDK